ncbi:MAG: cob(I)yrinic acid a,c-diamide adenosyltransferase [Chloroflexi bacterium]|nr:cob(I)yrinic acid a,c-diamide adenosyltransferase [Chloroflexota bacterium]
MPIFHCERSTALSIDSTESVLVSDATENKATVKRARTERARTERARTERARTERARTKRARTKRARTKRARTKKGLVIVHTGDGKGKSTAAIGIMTRAWGRGMKVGVIQFLKNENASFGETKAAQRMGIDWLSIGDGFTWTSHDLDETEARVHHGWDIAKEGITSGQYDIMILDEFTYPLHFGWLDTAEVLDWLADNKPHMLHVVITGRYAPQELIDYADLVTEMHEIKHPFHNQGIKAQPGIEF